MATVLIVDDSDDSRQFLRSLCEARAHDVSVAADGAAGLALARHLRPDLVVTDVLLPVLNGYELARRIRSDPRMPNTRVVLTTASTVNAALLELAGKCGVATVIPKPSEPEDVLAALDASLAAPPPALLTDGHEHLDQSQLGLLTADLSRKIDELHAANDGLRRNEEKFRRLLEVAPAAIVGVDTGGRITVVNALSESMFGYQAGELIGHLVDELVPEPLQEAHAGHRATYLASPRVRPMGEGIELEGRRKDGSRFPVTVSLSTLGQGDDLTVLAAVVDITERVAAERERARLEATLAQAQRLESVGQLAGGVAHDFNNLLAVILNYTQFVGKAVDDRPGVREDVRQMELAARRGADLVRQLLLFSRGQQADPQALALDDVLAGLRELLVRSIGEHVTLDVEVDPGAGPAWIDRGKLEQVVVNLVVNARDAMPRGGTIRIHATGADAGSVGAIGGDPGRDRYVLLTVADSGEGMTDAVRAHAFDPFFTTKPRGHGTGLGLATVYGVVTEAGGTVELDSVPGRGTRVHVYLPAAGSRTAAGAQEAAGAAPEQVAVAGGGGRLIMVVEDESAVREVARRILLENDYDVVAAGDPEEARAIAADLDAPPALVLSDVVMPGESGPELVRRLRARWPGLPAILMSGHAGRGGGDSLAGFDVMDKPFTEPELLARVRLALDER